MLKFISFAYQDFLFLLSSNLFHFFHFFFIPVNDTEEYWWYWNIYILFFWRLIVSSSSIIYHFDCNSRWDICEESMNWNLIQRKIPFLKFFSLSFIRLFDLCRRSCKLTNDDFKIPKWWWWTWWWGLRGVFALLAQVDDTQSDRNSSNEQNGNAMTLIILFLHRKFVDRIYTKESKEINDNKQPQQKKGFHSGINMKEKIYTICKSEKGSSLSSAWESEQIPTFFHIVMSSSSSSFVANQYKFIQGREFQSLWCLMTQSLFSCSFVEHWTHRWVISPSKVDGK